VARNRKRAKERRARRPQPVASRQADGRAQPSPPEPPERGGQPTERTEKEIERTEQELVPGPTSARPDELAPDPLQHAAPDVELADEQAAVGRDQPVEAADEAAVEEEIERENELVGVELEEQAEEHRDAALAASRGERPGIGGRLVGFLQGSWRELQRVQWPDRRQVAQATGVVLGFVIVAGVFLGVSDLLAQKLVNFILK
jgi:preprotein translocase subunit SecE